jgi:hypothetical protein
MDHGRKYGDRQSHPIPVWNGILEHRQRMGGAIWEFLWCIDRVTKEKDGVGMVLGGQPIKTQRILEDVPGSDRETIRLHMKSLEDQRYIRRRRTPYGHVIEVLNSQKRGIWKAEKPQNSGSGTEEKQQNPDRETVKHGETNRISGGNKEDTAVTQQDTAVTQQDTARAGRPDVWLFLGVDGSRVSPSIGELCRNFYRNKNGQTPIELIGECMDGIKGLGLGIPPVLAGRAKTLRSQERTMANTLPELEAEPWAK